MHQYKSQQWLPISMEDAWNFFSSPHNLSVITPPELDFKIVSDEEYKSIYNGMRISYIVKPLLGIPLKWETEIYGVENQQIFSDRQLKGPYKIWEHTHKFIEKNGGVMMEDEVNYALPFGALGKFIQRILVKGKIDRIFKFRREVLNNLFLPK